MSPRRASVLALTLALLTGALSAEAQETVAIRAAGMLDVESGRMVADPVDPLEDVRVLEDIHWVMLGGEVVRERAR